MLRRLPRYRRPALTSLQVIAAGLNDRGIETARGGEWSAVQVQRVLQRLG
jgi:Recombinase